MRTMKSKTPATVGHNLAALIPSTLAIVSLASLILLAQMGLLATTSYEVQRLEQVKTSWEARNHQLEAEIAALRALDIIEAQAKARLGMVPAQGHLFLRLPPVEPEAATVKDSDSSPAESLPWWQELLRSLTFWQR